MSRKTDKETSGPGEPAPEGSGSGAPGPTPERQEERKPPRTDLNEIVCGWVHDLEQWNPARMKRRPKALKQQVLKVLRRHLPPYPRPAGRPAKRNITEATRMFGQQRREISAGTRQRTNWQVIVTKCVPGFGKIRSDSRRRVVTTTLRNSVYARLKRQAARHTRNHRAISSSDANDGHGGRA
jgi:hypothetical protein